jgi:hypothetical protein
MRRWNPNGHEEPVDFYKEPLTEAKVRQIDKYIDEINEKWHSREYFVELLADARVDTPNPANDFQVIRHILRAVDWRTPIRGQPTWARRAKKDPRHTSFLERLEDERFPAIVINKAGIRDVLSRSSEDPDINELQGVLDITFHNLLLAERLEESKAEMQPLKQRVSDLYYQLQVALGIIVIEEEEDAIPEIAEALPIGRVAELHQRLDNLNQQLARQRAELQGAQNRPRFYRDNLQYEIELLEDDIRAAEEQLDALRERRLNPGWFPY